MGVDKQEALRQKQTEMDGALKELQRSIQESLTSSSSGSEKAAVIEQMRVAIQNKEQEKQIALQKKDQFHQEVLQSKELEMKRALTQKDKELETALNVAQQEVDKLLEQKQIEVDQLLDGKDHTIALMTRELNEARSKIRLSVAAAGRGAGESTNALKNLHALLDTKTMEVQQLEIDMKKLKDSHERNLA